MGCGRVSYCLRSAIGTVTWQGWRSSDPLSAILSRVPLALNRPIATVRHAHHQVSGLRLNAHCPAVRRSQMTRSPAPIIGAFFSCKPRYLPYSQRGQSVLRFTMMAKHGVLLLSNRGRAYGGTSSRLSFGVRLVDKVDGGRTAGQMDKNTTWLGGWSNDGVVRAYMGCTYAWP